MSKKSVSDIFHSLLPSNVSSYSFLRFSPSGMASFSRFGVYIGVRKCALSIEQISIYFSQRVIDLFMPHLPRFSSKAINPIKFSIILIEFYVQF